MSSAQTNQTAPLESRDDFESTPKGQYEYWDTELKAAQTLLKDWHKQGHEINNRYLDDRAASSPTKTGSHTTFRLNLFNSNVKTLSDMLYGQLPKIDVSRRNAIADDDPGRVAGLAMERMLNTDMEDNGKETDTILRAVLQDRLLPGMGCARVRYEVETAPAAEGEEVLQSEAAVIDYYYWNDVLWGWGRTFATLPWIAFRSYLTKDEVKQRFGDDTADELEYKKQVSVDDEDATDDPDNDSPWMKAEIWEIWDKKTENVSWYSAGHKKILEKKDDPLKLDGFFPCPPFFIANQTTKLYKPTPDYHLCQDLYNEIDVLQTRISILTEAVKVVGVYDASADGIQRIFNEGMENDLIPIDNWALFAEKGGIKGQIDWVPLTDITNALDKLRTIRDESIQLLQQVSGMADVMRGTLDNQYEGVGQSKIKEKFGSIRIQALQEEFARFVGDLMQLKAEIISKHFSAETIAKQSALTGTPDEELLVEAIKLIKDSGNFKLRVSVKPETLAMRDFAQLKEERSGYLNGLATFLQAAAPLIAQDKRSLPFLLEMLKWAMAGYKGAAEIEGVMDKAIDAMQKEPPKDDKPSPEQERGQIQIQLEKMRAESKASETQAKLQADMQIREHDQRADIATKQAEMQFSQMLEEFKASMSVQIMAAKLQADTQTELITSQINAQQNALAVDGEIEKEIIKQQGVLEQLLVSKRADSEIKMMEKISDSDEKALDRAAAATQAATKGGDDS